LILSFIITPLKIMADILNDRNQREPKTLCADFDELYAGHFDSLVNYLQARFRSCPEQAEEIAQSAFERIATRIRRGPIANLKAFLWRTAHNLAISDIRSKNVANRYKVETKRLFHLDEGYPLTPERVLEAREQLEKVLQAVRLMPEQRRRAFILTRFEGLTHSEASERLGIARPAISKHVAKATADIYIALHDDKGHGKKAE